MKALLVLLCCAYIQTSLACKLEFRLYFSSTCGGEVVSTESFTESAPNTCTQGHYKFPPRCEYVSYFPNENCTGSPVKILNNTCTSLKNNGLAQLPLIFYTPDTLCSSALIQYNSPFCEPTEGHTCTVDSGALDACSKHTRYERKCTELTVYEQSDCSGIKLAEFSLPGCSTNVKVTPKGNVLLTGSTGFFPHVPGMCAATFTNYLSVRNCTTKTLPQTQQTLHGHIGDCLGNLNGFTPLCSGPKCAKVAPNFFGDAMFTHGCSSLRLYKSSDGSCTQGFQTIPLTKRTGSCTAHSGRNGSPDFAYQALSWDLGGKVATCP
eukprot:TRINITY_DN4985_c0_g1_i1.p1 TRINITY_DN4985_c0_g1~~TRINITY_DN4985_c0_g1_i1.p1  ORF type:complete len:321 (+),score=7.40 TRINITY_DN4985_c0_g1_i1:62-1024(+)